MEKRRGFRILYWVFTVLLVVPMFLNSYLYFAKIPKVMEEFARFGYPTYLLSILGIAKILGGFAILSPKFPRIKEWAYAGFNFVFIGALLTHFFVGDGDYLGSIVFLVITGGSYYFWKKTINEKEMKSEG